MVASTILRFTYGLQRWCGRGSVRFSSTSRSLGPAPAICAVQILPKHSKRDEVDKWLIEGRALLEDTLRSYRPKLSVPGSVIIGSGVKSCFHWVHVPSSSEQHPDTVAIVFTKDTDLSLWRQSPQRSKWLAAGVARGLALDGKNMLVDAEKITLQKDDGSLGGWLPSSDGQRDLIPPPPSWKVAATVMLAMYPVQELNRLLLLPSMCGSETWISLPSTVQVFSTCAWTCVAVTVVLLPHARACSERIGFIGGRLGCPDGVALARASGRLLLLYGGLVGIGLMASEMTERMGMRSKAHGATSAGVWSELPSNRS